LDLLLVGFVAGFAFGGWRTGFLHRLAGLAFAAIAFVAGAYLRGPFGDLVHAFFPGIPADYAELLGYAFAFPVVLAVIHVIAYPFLKDKHMSGMTRELDKALGAIFGFIEAVLILSILVVIFDTYFGTPESLGQTPGLGYLSTFVTAFNESFTVHLLRQTTVPVVLTILGPLLPKDITSIIPGGIPGMPGIPRLPGPAIPTFGTPKP
jgi:uncharacterized membrane protein required for colicin V production